MKDYVYTHEDDHEPPDSVPGWYGQGINTRKEENMEDLIKALQIFLKYGNPDNPTNCQHDVLSIMEIDPEKVSAEDKAELERLGFECDEDEGYFYSFRFGSA